jgi:hypothetical protein
MYVWTDLPSLRDYSDGLMSVIASSKEEAIRLAADQFIGKAPTNVGRHAAFLLELRTHKPEVISTGAAYKLGGS